MKNATAVSKRGFASMDPQRQRELASIGGRTGHQMGVAHTFAPGSEAREAGRKGGLARAAKLREAKQASIGGGSGD